MFFFLKNFCPTESLVPVNEIPKEFIDDLYKCSELFITKQIKAIDRSLWYYDRYYNDHDIQQEISRNRNIMITRWCVDHKMRSIDQKNEILYLSEKPI